MLLLVAVVVDAAALLPQMAGSGSRSEAETRPAFWQPLSFGLEQRSFKFRIVANLVGLNRFLDRPVLGYGRL